MARLGEVANELEAAVDQASLHQVLEALAFVCHAKADHLVSNWGDAESAKAWTRAADHVERAAARVEPLGV